MGAEDLHVDGGGNGALLAGAKAGPLRSRCPSRGLNTAAPPVAANVTSAARQARDLHGVRTKHIYVLCGNEAKE